MTTSRILAEKTLIELSDVYLGLWQVVTEQKAGKKNEL